MIQEAELTNQVNEALATYRELYKKRYNVEPVILNPGIAQTIMRDILRKTGVRTTLALIETYLLMDGDNGWYARNGHSLAVFEKKIEEVNAYLGLNSKKQVAAMDPMISFESFCGNIKCNAPTVIVCKASEMGDKAYTELCPSCKESL